MAALLDTVSRWRKLEDATSSRDEIAPIFLMDEIAAMAKSSNDVGESIADHLQKKLGNKSPIVKWKSLHQRTDSNNSGFDSQNGDGYQGYSQMGAAVNEPILFGARRGGSFGPAVGAGGGGGLGTSHSSHSSSKGAGGGFAQTRPPPPASYDTPGFNVANVMGTESQLVDDICAPAGMRPNPDRADLQKFVESVSNMDGLKIADLLMEKMAVREAATRDVSTRCLKVLLGDDAYISAAPTMGGGGGGGRGGGGTLLGDELTPSAAAPAPAPTPKDPFDLLGDELSPSFAAAAPAPTPKDPFDPLGDELTPSVAAAAPAPTPKDPFDPLGESLSAIFMS
eukprot:gene22194-29254_t